MAKDPTIIVLALAGVAVGAACIEEGYDPWRPPQSVTSSSVRPAAPRLPPGGRVDDFPFEQAVQFPSH